MNIDFIFEIQRLKTLAETGLLYSTNEYDKERYTELHEMSLRWMSYLTNNPLEQLKELLPISKDYPTAKVDLRGLLLSEDKKILLVKESLDNKWALPGGWADVGFSPKEGITKEFKEETGLDVIPERLLAVFDKKMHPHPTQAFYVYKLAFYCTATSFTISKGFDVLDVQYFDIDNLPELSEDRILKSQIELLYQKVMSLDFEPYVD